MLYSKEAPAKLKPYLWHGIELDWVKGEKNASGDCPWCDKPKFGVSVANGKSRCFSCGFEGNTYSFIKKLWKESDELTTDYSSLAEDRGLMFPETLMHWGVCRCSITGSWLVPGYSEESKLQQLYKYETIRGKKLVWPTPTIKAKIFGMNLWDDNKNSVIICEGPWDAMALWECLNKAKPVLEDQQTRFIETANLDENLAADINVIGIPGCDNFSDVWLTLLEGKSVTVMFDNDHPKTHKKTGKKINPAGFMASKKLAGRFSSCSTPPSEINTLLWGESGYDLDLEDKTDVRDILTGKQCLN